MINRFSRTEMLLGGNAMEKLRSSHVAIFGIGGVGGHAAEALARCGVGRLALFDNDTVSLTNINRQAVATDRTVGMQKTEVMRSRIHDINPDAEVTVHNDFYLPENADKYPLGGYTYIVDAIDTVSAKLELAVRAKREDVPIISCMGTGNKLNPCLLEVSDIYKTSVCPLARVMRTELRKRGVKALKVVFSTEKALSPRATEEVTSKRSVPGSVSFVPSVAGLIIAGEVVKDITGVR